MKKGITYLSAAILALCATSCTEEEADLTPNKPSLGETIEVSFNAAASEGTKAVYEDIGEEYQHKWLVSDKLDLYLSDDTETSFSFLATTGESSNATFTGNLTTWEGEKDIYVLHNPVGFDCSFSNGTLKLGLNRMRFSIGYEDRFFDYGLLVGVMNKATTSPDVNIPDVTLNQVMSFLRIKFDGINPETLENLEIRSTNGADIFPSGAEINPSTGEVISLSESTYSKIQIGKTNTGANVITVPVIPSEITEPLTISYIDGDTTYEYNLSAAQISGFFERNTIHIGTVNWDDFTAVDDEFGTYTLSELNADGFDYTQQFSELYITVESADVTIDDFAGLQTLLKNQTCTDLDLYIEGKKNDDDTVVTYMLPASTFVDITSFDAVVLSNCFNIGTAAFMNCSSLIYIESANTSTVGTRSFANCAALTDISIPNLMTVGSMAFQNCTTLRDIEVSRARLIDDNAFENCTNLESVVLVSNTYAFYDLTLSDNAFYNCPKLNMLKIGSSSWSKTIISLGVSIFDSSTVPFAENVSLYIYDTCSPFITDVKTLKVGEVEYTFKEIYLNDVLYTGGLSSSSTNVSVANATKSEW